MCCTAVIVQGHAQKNSGSQCQSFLRTLWYGDVWVDLCQARSVGLPPAAFGREDGQSDSLQALLSCPYFYVESIDLWAAIFCESSEHMNAETVGNAFGELFIV